MSSITSLFGGSLAKRNCIGADNAPVSALYDYPDKMGAVDTLIMGSSTLNYYDMAYSGTMYVIIGINGAVWSSSDGITKTSRTVTGLNTATANAAITVSYANGFFLLCGLNASNVLKYWKSTDGISWGSELTPPVTGGSYTSIISSANTHIFVNQGVSTAVYQTSDGTTWTNITSKISGYIPYYSSLYNTILSETIGSYTFIYTLQDSTYKNNYYIRYVTSDSVTYTNIVAKGFSSVIYSNGLYYCYQSPGYALYSGGYTPNVYSTSDFITFTLVRSYISNDGSTYSSLADSGTAINNITASSFWNSAYNAYQYGGFLYQNWVTMKVENKLFFTYINTSTLTAPAAMSMLVSVSDAKSDVIFTKQKFNDFTYTSLFGSNFAKIKVGNYYLSKSIQGAGMAAYQITQQETYYP